MTASSRGSDEAMAGAASTPRSAPPTTWETLTEILVADTDRLETVKYAELGIPMFLVGQDLSADAGARVQDIVDPLGARLARLASILALRKPELDADDIAKLLEVMAERYFLEDETSQVGVDNGWEPEPDDLWLPAGAPHALAELVDGMARARTIRLVNFHSTPRYREDEFRAQMAAYARVFEPITPGNFSSAIDGSWRYDRPGLMPALYEGYRDNLDVMVPILEEFGFTGWFFVPTAFLSVPPHEQRRYAAAHDLFLPEQDEYPDDRIALTWHEAREIARRGHAFVCHTRTHSELTPTTSSEMLDDEIVVAKGEIDRELDEDVNAFCWLEGAALGVNARADALLADVGIRYLFSNFKVQKLW